MTDSRVAALARKWCVGCRTVTSVVDYHNHDDITAAIREALEEAEKIVRTTSMDDVPLGGVLAMHAVNFALGKVADAIAALRSGKP